MNPSLAAIIDQIESQKPYVINCGSDQVPRIWRVISWKNFDVRARWNPDGDELVIQGLVPEDAAKIYFLLTLNTLSGDDFYTGAMDDWFEAARLADFSTAMAVELWEEFNPPDSEEDRQERRKVALIAHEGDAWEQVEGLAEWLTP